MKKFAMMLLVLALATLVSAGSAYAKGGKGGKHGGKKHAKGPDAVFAKIDTNHDGSVTEGEFVAFKEKEASKKAHSAFQKMGGTADKGLSLEQFKQGLEAAKGKHKGKKS